MTASDHLFSIADRLFTLFSRLSMAELALNLILTCGVVAVGLLTAWSWGRLLRWTAGRLPGEPSAERKIRTTRVIHWADGLLSVFGIALGVIVVCRIWGVDILAWASAGLGEQLVAGVLRLGLILFAAVGAMELAGFLISQGMAKMVSASSDPRRRAQLNTLGPLLRGIAQTTIVIVFSLMALGEIGVKIGPLLAGAGVVGVALGFGAQTLVKDFLTGLFLVVEDIVSVGDIVRIGDSGGQVEQMTLRTIRLRDFNGTLHVFPYGEAQVVHNLTKSFSYYVFDLQVAYSADLDRALAVMRGVGDELEADPAFREKILAPLEVVGVDSLADNGVMLKARIKTLPIEQWTVGREYNRRIKLAFDREGIEIPFPHMQLVLPDSLLSEMARR